jgi:hypothetical protein
MGVDGTRGVAQRATEGSVGGALVLRALLRHTIFREALAALRSHEGARWSAD